MLDEPFHRPAQQLGLFADDDAPAPVASDEQTGIEVSEDTKDAIRRAFLRGAMQTALLARYGIDRRTLTDVLADCFDPDAGPSDRELDEIFGIHTRPPGWSPDERGDDGTKTDRPERRTRRTSE